MDKPKQGVLVLISKFFGLSLKQMQEENRLLTPEDRAQLGSAIARQTGQTDNVNFELVPY